jgi:hypothetical protein
VVVVTLAIAVVVAVFVAVVVDWFDVWFDVGDVHPTTSTAVITITAINPISCFFIVLPLLSKFDLYSTVIGA